MTSCVRIWEIANNGLVQTASARGNFGILARHKRVVVVSASSCRTRRWGGGTTQALALYLSNNHNQVVMN